MSKLIYVPGSGPLKAHTDYMFVGEAPGAKEEELGKSFVGPSGKLLDKWIKEGLQLKREQVYVTNIVKVRPQDNRTPTSEEIASWLPILKREIEDVNPLYIITVGTTATQAILGVKKTNGDILYNEEFDLNVMSIYHPSFIMRQRSKNTEVIEALKNLKQIRDDWYEGRE